MSGLLGRAGGSGNYPRAFRVVGIPLLLAVQAFLMGVHSWWLLLFIPLSIGAISSYHDYLGYDNYWMHGFVLGLASFAICLSTGHWWLFVARTAILACFMGILHKFVKSAVPEEFLRYAVLPTSLLLIV